MYLLNENFSQVNESYLFANIAHRVAEYQRTHPETEPIIKMGIGDVTRPITPTVIQALHAAVEEMGNSNTFRGYGPEQGYAFLQEAIIQHDYTPRGVSLDTDEVFISDGAKSDLGNIGDILSKEAVVAVTDPVYPVYVDTNLMAGRKIVYLTCNEENSFIPDLPQEHVDVIYLCYPNNPTGTALRKEELQKWVDYALREGSLILFDSAYEAYISDPAVPHSIFECDGAKQCAIEFRSFSKTAGFTGLRCGYTVVPKSLRVASPSGLTPNKMWNRRQTTKFNGVPYIVQRAAEAVFSPQGWHEQMENVAYYMRNAQMLRDAFQGLGHQVYGAENGPYVWFRVPDGYTSWSYFDHLLDKYHIVATPGVGFGSCGEGYMRLTGFGSRENTEEAVRRLKR